VVIANIHNLKFRLFAFLRKVLISLNLYIFTNITDNKQKIRINNLLNKYFPDLNLNLNSIVIDFGSNRGRFSMAVSMSGARVFAFEPNFEAFNYSYRKLLNYNNVKIFNVAVSNKSGLINLYHHPNYKNDPLGYSVSSSLLSDKLNVSESDAELVLSIKVDEIFDNFDKIDLLKVDVEGSERFLWPAIQDNFKKIEYLLLEIHEDRIESKSDWVKGARSFIREKNLETKWRLDWE